ncbi:hypothetical protein [Spirulina sp. 06S082]|uniref:hypothetical protein n=1 Tax=Spirulina sp. 06S082 TaxID=3110248 RepID=UPI002B1E908B|nr:hypothetical protein [Spirulina sp. 06S082]MEA5469490.1 hypothetical protein [Spirulina sp. 06S082]
MMTKHPTFLPKIPSKTAKPRRSLPRYPQIKQSYRNSRSQPKTTGIDWPVLEWADNGQATGMIGHV